MKRKPVLEEPTVNFKGQNKTLSELFGNKSLTMDDVQEKLWDYVVAEGLLSEAKVDRSKKHAPRR